jgi:hypothetical protein
VVKPPLCTKMQFIPAWRPACMSVKESPTMMAALGSTPACLAARRSPIGEGFEGMSSSPQLITCSCITPSLDER